MDPATPSNQQQNHVYSSQPPANQQQNPMYSSQPPTNHNPLAEMQAAISQALANQSAMFDAKLQSRDLVIEKLMGKLESFSVNTNPPANTASSSKPTPKNKSTPRKGVNFKSSTPVKKPIRAASEPPPSLSKTLALKKVVSVTSSPGKDKPSTPQKRRPHQAITGDYPKGFEKTKVSVCNSTWLHSWWGITDILNLVSQTALEVHVRVLWGMIQTKSVPPAVDEESLQLFHASFQDLKQVQRAIESVGTPLLVAKSQIKTLRDASMGKIKLGRGMVTLDQQAIFTIHGALAKAGLSKWGPDLTQSHDSLFNAACRYLCLQTFREVAVGPSYRFLGVNPEYVDDIGVMTSAYNHYVHFLSAAKFKREVKAPGHLVETENMKTVSKRRERVSSKWFSIPSSHTWCKDIDLRL